MALLNTLPCSPSRRTSALTRMSPNDVVGSLKVAPFVVGGVARLVERDGDVQARAKAVPEDERATEVRKHLVLDDRALLVTVRVVDDERLVAPVADDPDGRAHVAAQVDRIEDEPVAAAVCGVEPVEGKPLGLSGCRPAGEE